jgi:hypothetical protein
MKLCSVQKCQHPPQVLQSLSNVYLFEIDQMKVYNGYTVCASIFQTFRLRHEQQRENTAIPSLQIPMGKVKTI